MPGHRAFWHRASGIGTQQEEHGVDRRTDGRTDGRTHIHKSKHIYIYINTRTYSRSHAYKGVDLDEYTHYSRACMYIHPPCPLSVAWKNPAAAWASEYSHGTPEAVARTAHVPWCPRPRGSCPVCASGAYGTQQADTRAPHVQHGSDADTRALSQPAAFLQPLSSSNLPFSPRPFATAQPQPPPSS